MASILLTYSAILNGDTITFHDEIDADGEVLIEVKSKDHAGFDDDTDFYLSKTQLVELKLHIERIIGNFD